MLATTPIHESLYRPVLLAGLPSRLLILEVVVVFLLIFEVGFHLPTFALAAAFVLLVHPLAGYFAAREPLFLELYLRSLRMADYYPPLPEFPAPLSPAPPSVPSR